MATINVLVEMEGEHHVIRSPAVGSCSMLAEDGELIAGPGPIGRIKVLNSWHLLVLPESVQGTAVIGDRRDAIFPVEYGQELLRIERAGAPAESRPRARKAEAVASGSPGDTGCVIVAPTTGILYRRSSPDVPPYVVEGQEVQRGTVLGLIEIMKVFNHLVFQGTGASGRGRVTRILVEDAQEVTLGQPLFLIEIL
jgi:acetyl-CoA carboxylase biotin carboxyl carrier protein